MAGKPSKASEKGAEHLRRNPEATSEQVARHCGLTVSAVLKSKWWKSRNVAQKAEAAK